MSASKGSGSQSSNKSKNSHYERKSKKRHFDLGRASFSSTII